MLKFLIYLCFSSIFIFDWLYLNYNIGSRYLTWVPEVISIFLVAYIIYLFGVKKVSYVPFKYYCLFFVFIVHIFLGIIVNDMELGPVFAGLRQYFRFIPFFFLSAVVSFNNLEIKNLMIFFLLLGLIQVPVAFWQRFIAFAGEASGDPVGGTLGASTSGTLSLFLLVILTFLLAFYLKKLISKERFIVFSILIFIPTVLNETKITLLILPFAFLIPIIFMQKERGNKLKAIFALTLLSTMILVFSYSYNQLFSSSIEQFYTQEDVALDYSEARLGPVKTAFDKILSSDLENTLFGYGAGNVSHAYTAELQGEMFSKFSKYDPGAVSFTKLLWETGFIGIINIFLILICLFYDSLKKCRKKNIEGALALGMISYIVIFSLSFFYTRTIDVNIFVFTFFFFSGVVVNVNNIVILKNNH